VAGLIHAVTVRGLAALIPGAVVLTAFVPLSASAEMVPGLLTAGGTRGTGARLARFQPRLPVPEFPFGAPVNPPAAELMLFPVPSSSLNQNKGVGLAACVVLAAMAQDMSAAERNSLSVAFGVI
jgi:hypothetical protein